MNSKCKHGAPLHLKCVECWGEENGNSSTLNNGLSAEHTPSHIIVFEDTDHPLEVFFDEDVARARLDALGDNWSCHLYKLVESR